MKKSLLRLSGSLIMLLLTAINATGQTRLSKPQFSLQSGFYESSIELTCNCEEPGAEVRYTLDGSVPTIASDLYTTPLNLETRVGEENTISNISTSYDHIEPDEVFKAHVLTAKCFKSGFTESEPKSNTYFIGDNIMERYETLAVVSLIADNGNFFDYDTGIYILGVNEDICQFDACGNYGQRGIDWERKVHFEFWESSRNEIAISRDLGVRIHGGATRNNPQKALRFYARDQYGKKDLEYPLFGEEGPTSFKRFMLRAGGNDLTTKMRDAYHQQFFTGTGVETQLYKPCVLFINGEFWGYHGIRESYNKHYFNSYYDIDKDAIDYISEGPPDIIDGGVIADEGDLIAFDELLDYLESNDISLTAGYNYVKKEVNIQSLATIYIAELFLGNVDWPGNNVKIWRPKDKSRKWEWCLVDTDISSSGIVDVDYFSLDIPPGEGSYTEPIILNMLLNEEFRHYYINRWADLLNTRLLAASTGSKLDLIEAKMSPVIEEQSERWFSPYGIEDWEIEMANQKTWMQERLPVVWEELEDYYDITTAGITLDVSDNNHGGIKCNSIPYSEIDAFPWSGDYFEEIPITLTAINKPGYQFVEWVGDINSMSQEISVVVTNNMNITAVFEPLATTIVMNELMASNATTMADDSGEYDDWIELFNTTNKAINVSGYFLSDDPSELDKWTFPEGTIIDAYSYLIVWADKDTAQAGLHANFKLNKGAGGLILSNSGGIILDETQYNNQTKDVSWGRYINGAGPFITMPPTFSAKNSSPGNNSGISDELIVYPNPANNSIVVLSNGESLTPMKIFNSMGKPVFESAHQGLYEEKIDVSNWSAGLYLVYLNDKVVKLIIY